jgi:RHS repeat-associated protein
MPEIILHQNGAAASVVTDATGVTVGEQRYYPFGETRLTSGTIYTDKLFTGQREITGLGIYHYQARFYSPRLGRFLSPDTIVPNPANPQDLNRFSYVRNNPLRYTDPGGHMCSDPDDPDGGCESGGTFITQKQIKAHAIAYKIRKKFSNVTIKNVRDWEPRDLQEIYTGLTEISSNGFNGDTFGAAFGEVTFVPQNFPGNKVGDANWQTGVIRLDPNANWTTVVHEMGHILDGGLKHINGNVLLYSKTYAGVFDSDSGATDYGGKNSSEDFADSFLMVIQFGSYSNPKISDDRVKVITALIQSYTNPNHTLSPGR